MAMMVQLPDPRRRWSPFHNTTLTATIVWLVVGIDRVGSFIAPNLNRGSFAGTAADTSHRRALQRTIGDVRLKHLSAPFFRGFVRMWSSDDNDEDDPVKEVRESRVRLVVMTVCSWFQLFPRFSPKFRNLSLKIGILFSWR